MLELVQNTSYQCLWLFVLEWEECMENRILENLQHFLMTKVKEHIILWTLLERMCKEVRLMEQMKVNELTAVLE